MLALLVFPGPARRFWIPTLCAAASPSQQIGMKVLLITDTSLTPTTRADRLQDWENTLKREGVPFDTVVTTTPASAACRSRAVHDTAPTGTQVANYEGVVVATSGRRA